MKASDGKAATMDAGPGIGQDADPFRVVAEHGTDIAYTTVASGAVSWITPAVERVLGWRPDQIVGRPLRTLVHPADASLAEHWRARLLAPAAPGRPSGGTSEPVRLARADGTYVWCRVTVAPVRDDSGAITAVTGIVHDVDDLVRARLDSAEAHRRLHAVLDAFLDPHVTLTAIRNDGGAVVDFIIEDVNTPGAEYYDFTPADMIGRTISELMGEAVGRADIVRAAWVLDSSAALVINDDESAFRQSQGRPPAWVDVRISPVDHDRVSYTWRDVTERHLARDEIMQARDLLRTTIDAHIDPLALFRAVRDDNGNIVDFRYEEANEAAAIFEGLDRESLIGQSMLSIKGHEGEAAEDIADCTQVLITGVPIVANGVACLTYADGSGRPIIIDMRIVPVDAERVSFAWRDVTDQHAAQQELQRAQRELARSHDLLRTVIDGHVDPHVVLAPVCADDGSILDFVYEDANEAAAAFEGRTRSSLLGATLRAVYKDEREAEEDIADCAAVLSSGEPLSRNDSRTLGYVDDQGRPEFVDIRIVPLGHGRVLYTWRDVTARHFDQQALARSEERFRLLAENMSDVVILLQEGSITWVSPSVARVVGIQPEQIIGRDPVELAHPDDLELIRGAAAAADAGTPARVRCRAISAQGGYHWVDVEANLVAGADPKTLVLSARIVDAEVEALQALQRQARHDELTGLVNRHAVFEHLGRVLDREVRSGTRLAMVFCDLDGFKAINDQHGHSAGDELLRRLGERLQGAVRSGDLVARIGGDEFLVVLDGVQDLDNAVEIAEKLRQQVTLPVEISGIDMTVGASVGVTLAERGENVDGIVARADDAMYLAKRRGKGAVVAIPGTTPDR